jgi:hypothetical protein
VVIRNAAGTVVLADVLGLRESSVVSLTARAQNITHTAANEVFRERQGIMARRTRGQELLTYHRAGRFYGTSTLCFLTSGLNKWRSAEQLACTDAHAHVAH